MAAWSNILRTAGQKLLQNSGFRTKLLQNGQARCMSDEHVMHIRPTRFQWHKTKDYFHYYFLLGAIPVGIGITLVNVFIGPATLEEIPEGYIPKEWEYHQHPIKRFLARYFFPSPQQEYEKYLHHIYHENQVRKVRLLEARVNDAMSHQHDYRDSPYFREIYGAKYLHKYRQSLDKRVEIGDE